MLLNVKNSVIYRRIFSHIFIKRTLNLIRYNNRLQKILRKNINNLIDYYEYSVEMEIIPYYSYDGNNKFINNYSDNNAYINFVDEKEKYSVVKADTPIRNKIKKIKIILFRIDNTYKRLFYKCEGLYTITFTKPFEAPNDMNRFFSGCKNLEYVDFGKIKTHNCLDMSYMFSECEKMKRLDLSSFDTSNVTSMHGMFLNCKDLINFNLETFDTRNVEDMSIMFMGCNSMKWFAIGNFQTGKLQTMEKMFAYCGDLEYIDLSNVIITKDINISDIFYRCKKLKIIALNNSKCLSEKQLSNIQETGGDKKPLISAPNELFEALSIYE